jgi:hypothetical protein
MNISRSDVLPDSGPAFAHTMERDLERPPRKPARTDSLSRWWQALVCLWLVLAGAPLRADVMEWGEPGFIKYVTVDAWSVTYVWDGSSYSSSHQTEHQLFEGDSLWLPDEYYYYEYSIGHEWQMGWDETYVYYSTRGITYQPIDEPSPPGGGEAGDEPIDPPVTDPPGPIFGDDVHDHEVIPSKVIEPDPKTVEYGRAKITLTVELREVATGQPLGTEQDLASHTMPYSNGGKFHYRGAGKLDAATIEIESVPGKESTYRGKGHHIQLGSIVWYNKDRYPGPKPSLATMHAEYQHYSEYAKRLEALVEELEEIIRRDRFGLPNQVKNRIKNDMGDALLRFQRLSSAESQRYDSESLDITDPDVGTHRGDLGRKVRVPENFTTFPSQWPTP